MNSNEYIVVSASDGKIVGGSKEQSVQSETQSPSREVNTAVNPGSTWVMLGIWAVFLVGMYFLMSRPQKKNQARIAEMQSKLTVDDEVVTSNGFHGKIVDIEDKIIVIEFGVNKGIRIPVSKSNVFKKVEEDK